MVDPFFRDGVEFPGPVGDAINAGAPKQTAAFVGDREIWLRRDVDDRDRKNLEPEERCAIFDIETGERGNVAAGHAEFGGFERAFGEERRLLNSGGITEMTENVHATRDLALAATRRAIGCGMQQHFFRDRHRGVER